MERPNPISRILLALVIIGFLALGGTMVFQMGYNQGAATAGAAVAAASGQNGQQPAPFYGPGYGPGFYPYYGWGFRPFFFPWMCFLGIGLFFLLGGFFRRWGWRGGYYGGKGHHHGPPWAYEHGHERGDQPQQQSESEAGGQG